MIEEGLSLLIDYGTYLLPGFSLCALWFWLTPKTQPGLRIAILLLTFVLMRDVMTPLRLWSLSGDVQIGFVANPFVLAVLGALSLAIVAALARIAPQLWQLVVWRKGNLAAGLGCRVLGLPFVSGTERHPDWLADSTVHVAGGAGLCFRPHALRRDRRHRCTRDGDIAHRRSHVIGERRSLASNESEVHEA